jgi:putative DNA primase/helicase
MLAQDVVGSNGATPEAHGVLTIVGDQAAGKTRWIRRLCPAEYSMVGVQLSIDQKDSKIESLARWIVELGEVSATKSKSGAAALKAFLTRPSDYIRYPYDRRANDIPRRTVYFATENSTRFLTDETGNRRWWTIRVNKLDHQHHINMQQLWAQAYHLIHQGEQWWLTDTELAELNQQNRIHEEDDPVDHMLAGGLKWSTPAHQWTWREIAIVLDQVGVKTITPAACRRAVRYFRDHDIAVRTPTHLAATQALVPPPGTDFRSD